MKKIYQRLFLIAAASCLVGACKKFVDINDNPNTLTGSVAEEFILPKTIVSLANSMTYATSYGEELTGYTVNAGGVSGWGSFVDYNFGPGTWTGWWNRYDNITDLNQVIAKSAEDENYILYGGVAKIIKAVEYQSLVDQYNNVPFTEANLGQEKLTPKYDKGPDIYKALADMLDEAIADFNKGASSSSALKLNNVSDPMFGGNLIRWKQYANTIKLRLILRGGDKVSWTNKTFSNDGFLSSDAMVQPGYAAVAGKLNRTWDRTYNVSGAAQAGGLQQRVPSFFTVGFYDGNKLNDVFRGNLIYRAFPNPGINMLGNDPGTAAAAKVKAPNDWFVSIGTPSASNYAAIGIFKGPSAPQVVMLAAESNFLQAEGILKGLVTGDIKEKFNTGVLESFRYLNKDEGGNVSSKYVDRRNGKLSNTPGVGRMVDSVLVMDTVAINPQMEFEEYVEDNANDYLVNFDLATTNAQKLEAIITQKYIAFNMLFGAEAWNEYRRTGYPTISGTPVYNNRYGTFVSTQSPTQYRADRLPTRIQYPQSEFTYNAANVGEQKGQGLNGIISVFLDKIFWAK